MHSSVTQWEEDKAVYKALFHEHVQWSYFRNAAMQAHTMLLHNQVWVHHVGWKLSRLMLWCFTYTELHIWIMSVVSWQLLSLMSSIATTYPYIYMYIYISEHVMLWVCVCVCLYTCLAINTYVDMCECMCLYRHACRQAGRYDFTCQGICFCPCGYVYMYIYIHMTIYIYYRFWVSNKRCHS